MHVAGDNGVHASGSISPLHVGVVVVAECVVVVRVTVTDVVVLVELVSVTVVVDTVTEVVLLCVSVVVVIVDELVLDVVGMHVSQRSGHPARS